MKSQNRNLPSRTLFCLTLIGILLASIPGCNKSSTGGGGTGPIWLTFNKANHQLIGNHVNSLYLDDEGIVWVATDSGASFFNHGTWSSFSSDLAYPTYYNGGERTASTVNSVTQGQDRSIWFALNGGGIARYNQFAPQSVWKRYTTSNGIPYDLVTALARGQTTSSGGILGEIWCATYNGVGHFIPAVNEGGVWVNYRAGGTDNTLPSSQVRAVALNVNDNSVWFGSQDPTSGSSCVVYVNASLDWQPPRIIPAPYDAPIVSIAFDRHNIAWFAKWQGVSSMNTKTFEWTHYTNASTKGVLPPGNVNSVTTDYDLTRWFGTNAGLVRMVDTTWTKFNRLNTPQLPSDTVTALTRDLNGNLWIGTPQGVAVYNPAGTRF